MGAVLEKTSQGLWHTTHPSRFESILKTGAILPEPNIPDSQRWHAKSPDTYPYVRTLGGVSLFDLQAFDAEQYAQEFPVSSWHTFIPYRDTWGSSVWIEIDQEKHKTGLISGEDLIIKWKLDSAYRHTIMPRIEVAHIGAIPKTSFKSAFLASRGNAKPQFYNFTNHTFERNP